MKILNKYKSKVESFKKYRKDKDDLKMKGIKEKTKKLKERNITLGNYEKQKQVKRKRISKKTKRLLNNFGLGKTKGKRKTKVIVGRKTKGKRKTKVILGRKTKGKRKISSSPFAPEKWE